MGLFSSLTKILIDSASGIKYVDNKNIENKAEEFILKYRYLLQKTYVHQEKVELVTAFIITAIATAKSDGTFSKTEVSELIDFIIASLDEDIISRDEALDLIKEFIDIPIDMTSLANIAVNLAKRYGNSVIDTLRSFIIFIIYSDGEIHPKELEFLDKWNKTVQIVKTHS